MFYQFWPQLGLETLELVSRSCVVVGFHRIKPREYLNYSHKHQRLFVGVQSFPSWVGQLFRINDVLHASYYAAPFQLSTRKHLQTCCFLVGLPFALAPGLGLPFAHDLGLLVL